MSKKTKNKIVFLLPSDSIKANVIIHSIFEHEDFYGSYEIVFIFDKNEGKNIELVKKYSFKFFVTDKNLDILSKENYDILITCGWGWKVPNNFIKKATIAAINAHSSYLPDYKGASVYFHYWANLEKYAGATIHYLTENFDEGNIITQEKCPVSFFDTPKFILLKISYLTAVLIRESILLIENGYKGKKQPNNGRYFYKINKYKLLFYRFFNIFLRIINKKILTPHKGIFNEN